MFSWQKAPKPIIGLSPMDGISDFAYRQIHAKYGKPDVMFTEFTNVEGMFLSPHDRLFTDLMYHPLQRPIIAQIFGSTPEYFYKAAIICCDLGFDGIDINMGCPAKNVAHHGGGAALIGHPELAKQIIRSVKQGVIDWSNGKTINELDLSEEKISKIHQLKQLAQTEDTSNRNQIPVSVKTRIGITGITIKEWVNHLLEETPANITVHGRTLKQMYTGQADWDAIARAAEIISQTETTILGNGDIQSREEALRKIEQYKVNGVLIGRASMGNPNIWKDSIDKILEPSEKLSLALEHAHLHAKYKDPHLFIQMRKHFSFYVSNYPNANTTKIQLLKSDNIENANEIIAQAQKDLALM